jgi:hypothetical protein
MIYTRPSYSEKQLFSNRIARTIFTAVGSKMYLLHGFIKKTQKTPKSDLELADQRKREVIYHEKERIRIYARIIRVLVFVRA